MSRTVIVTLDAIETITKTAEVVVRVPDTISSEEIMELVLGLDLASRPGGYLDWQINQQKSECNAPHITVLATPANECDIELEQHGRKLRWVFSNGIACRNDRRKQQLVDIMLRNECWNAVIDYAKEMRGGRWPEAEDRIYELGSGDWMMKYATRVIKGRWPRVETLIVKTGYAERYAKEVLPGRWDEEVAKKCPCCLYYYAKDVIGGKLPEELHNLMLAEAIKDSNDPWIKKYSGAKKYQRPRHPH